MRLIISEKPSAAKKIAEALGGYQTVKKGKSYFYVVSDDLVVAPAVFWWSLPLTAGYLLAIPFAVVTASPALGRLFVKLGLCGIPEDFAPPKEVTAVLAQ